MMNWDPVQWNIQSVHRIFIKSVHKMVTLDGVSWPDAGL
jgi:hypothetical protein